MMRPSERQSKMGSTIWLLCVCLALVLITSGCVFQKLKEEIAGLDSTAGLGGIITNRLPSQGKILVFLLASDGKQEIQQMTFLPVVLRRYKEILAQADRREQPGLKLFGRGDK